ncbi:hypothetical protein CkaCkLH20_07059 [Colletotrichum karsti]|uniref:Major facilitator superfamily (MFS) profile domain-containing protein n=1 Tax=Colletotrichum karsti TaxID=1095194 RepID=A0A9P6I2V6_9PEZI|nr:uncharacterized protein CkaCkLH20_07059 [Colletotrichum karsti]KAF9875239.1 hypothetical protein CkaCkLH20_07059 [Colletotrichum karsti]
MASKATESSLEPEINYHHEAEHIESSFKGIFSNKYVTICAAFSTLGGAMFGFDQGVVSVTLVMDQFLHRFPEVADGAAGAGFKKGLLTAMIELGAFLGAMNQGWIADKISRRWSIMVAVGIFLVGSAIQTGSMNYNMLAAGRFVGGIGVGMMAMVAPLYISEIAPPEIRGTLLVLQELSIVTAIVAAFYTTYGTRHIQSEWSWRLPFLVQMAPALILGAGVPFLPYSPRWLASRGRDDEALKVLCKLRQLPATDRRVLCEWLEIRSEVAFCKEQLAERHPSLQDPSLTSRMKLNIVGYLDCFRPGAWKRTHVGIGLMFFQQFVGINALIYYSPTLFGTMGLNYEMRLDMSGVMNICQVVACFFSLWAMDRFGRRPLLLAGGICMVISHFIIAVLVGKFRNEWATRQAEAWTSVAFLLFFMLTFGATWGPIPWAMPAEIFPSSLRAKGMAYTTMSNWLNNFIIGLITPPLIQNTGFASARPTACKASSGSGKWSQARAAYLLTNDKMNSIVALPIGPDGLLAAGTVTSSSGAGSNSISGMTNKPAAPDALVSQSALTVVGSHLFSVNAGSNTVSMFKIDAADPTKLTMVGQPAVVPGEFPNTVAASDGNKLVCVATTGAKAGIACAPFSESGIGAMDGLRPIDLNQSTPPVGPTNTVSQVFFSADGRDLYATVKGDPTKNNTGFFAAYPVARQSGTARVSQQPVRSSPKGTAVLFGSSTIPNSDNVFVTDASFGAAVLSVDSNSKVATVKAKAAIDGQKATCWVTISPATHSAFVTDVASNRLVEMSLVDASIKNTIDLASNGDPGLVDLKAAGRFIYALSPGNGTTQAAVTVVDAMSKQQVQHFELKALGVGGNAQGMALFL